MIKYNSNSIYLHYGHKINFTTLFFLTLTIIPNFFIPIIIHSFLFLSLSFFFSFISILILEPIQDSCSTT